MKSLKIVDIVNRDIKLLNESQIPDFKPVKLKYSFDGLLEFIDPKTMELHYEKHYKSYVQNLNTALNDKNFKLKNGETLENLIKKINSFNKNIKNQAGGAYNHQLFWNFLTPEKEERKFEGKIKTLIENQFGSLEVFKEEFTKQAMNKFGSGWIWVLLNKNKIKIMTTSSQDNPKMNIFMNKDKHNDGSYVYKNISGKIILCLDLWEHAYYLKYYNKKEEYINNFWKVVNWKYVNSLL